MSLTQCQTCRAVIAKSARACPQCGAQRGLGRILVWGVLIAVAIGATALIDNDQPDSQAAGSVNAQAPKAAVAKRDAVVAGELLGISPDYAPDVARMLNLLMAEHQPCQQDIQPLTAASAVGSSNPANPAFTVVCGAPKKVLVHFTWMDAVNKRIPAQPAPPVVITQSNAADLCERAARSNATRPGSVDMSRVWSAGFQERPDGTAVYQTTFKASNAFGVEDEFQITCQFSGMSLTGSRVQPAG